MMLDSGARGSKDQIRQLTGMRGLMAKPQKSGATSSELSKILFSPTLRRDFLFLNTSSPLTVPGKVLQILLSKQQMQGILPGDWLMSLTT
jgi:hypothetical protein